MVNTKSIFGKWDYAIDSSTDGLTSQRREPRSGGTPYEIYGIAVKQTADKVYFAINTNLPPEGRQDRRATDDFIRWGDLILNFTGSNLEDANGKLVGIRFDGENEAGVADTGVFSDVTAKSVVLDNVPFIGRDTVGGYNQLVREAGGTPSNGDLGAEDPYFNLNRQIPNVIASGNRVGGVAPLSSAEMKDLNFGTPGRHTFGFAVDRALLPKGNFTLHVAPECGNDVVALTGKLFGTPAIDIEKKTNLVDIANPEDAIPLKPGDSVLWTYEVKNTGEVPFTFNQVKVTDDKVAPISFIESSDDKQDRILSPGETWRYAASGVAEDLKKTTTPVTKTIDLDFETDGSGNALEAGAFIDDEYKSAYGLTISSIKLADGKVDPNHNTMIFDTANPTLEDDDLGTPNQLYGGPGNSHQDPPEETNNTKPLGNVLIISQDNNPNDPNDKADGGIMRFDWENPTQLNYIDLLDVDKADTRNKIRTYDEQGNLLHEYSVPARGNNSVQRLQLNGELASRMEMVFDPSADGSASGAIANIGFTQTEYIYKNVGKVTVDGFVGVKDTDASYYRNGEPTCICPPFATIPSPQSAQSSTSNQLFQDDQPTPFSQPPTTQTTRTSQALSKDDLLQGTPKQDTLRGCQGNDKIEGLSGDDLLWGGKDQDVLYAHNGNDQIRGGAGRNEFWGGRGQDQFVLSPNGLNVIQDFQINRDAIALKGAMNFEDLSILGRGSNTIIKFQDEAVAKLNGVTPDSITADSFVTI